MIITYTPEGGEPKSWEWSPGRLRMSEATRLEKKFRQIRGIREGQPGGSLDNLKMAVLNGESDARRLVLYSLLKRDQPGLILEDVDPYADEIKVELTTAEMVEWRKNLLDARGIDEVQREQMLAMLDAEIEAAGGEPGKAISKTSS